MSTNLNDIYQVLNQLRADLPALMQRRIQATQIVVGEGLSDISKRLGLIQAGEFRAGNSLEPGFGFSGVRMGYPAFSYGGSLWNIAGVSNDVIQFGLDASTGKAIAGAGVVTLDATGVTFDVGSSGTATSNAVKWNSSGVEYYRIIGWTSGAAVNQLFVQANRITTKHSQIFMSVDSVTETISGSPSQSSLLIAVSKDGGTQASFTMAATSTTDSTVTIQAKFLNLLSSATDKLGAFGTSPAVKQTVTGSRGGNAALASLLTALATYGLIVDSSTA